MMITTLVIILISHCLASSIVVGDPDPPTKSLITRICSKTVNIKECDMIIRAQLDTPHADILTITKVTTKRALTFAVETVGQIRDFLLPKATDSRDKALFLTCGIAYQAVVSQLQGAELSLSRGDYVALKAQQNQALTYIQACIKKTDFFRRTPIVGVNYYASLMTNMASIAANILAPPTAATG